MRVLLIFLITLLLIFTVSYHEGKENPPKLPAGSYLINFPIFEAWERTSQSIIERYSDVYLISRDTISNGCTCYYKFNEDNSYQIYKEDEIVCTGEYEYRFEWSELILRPSRCLNESECVDIGIYIEYEKGYVYKINIENEDKSMIKFAYEICNDESTTGVYIESYQLFRTTRREKTDPVRSEVLNLFPE